MKRLLKKYKGIDDFIIFGSFLKGKFIPGDIDIAVITEERDIDFKYKIVSEFEQEFHIEFLPSKTFFEEKIWKSLMLEGFSIRKNKFLRDILGLNPNILFKYDLSKLNRSGKTMFNRGLHKILKESKAFQISPGSLMVPLSSSGIIDDFLKSWKDVKSIKWRIIVV